MKEKKKILNSGQISFSIEIYQRGTTTREALIFDLELNFFLVSLFSCAEKKKQH